MSIEKDGMMECWNERRQKSDGAVKIREVRI